MSAIVWVLSSCFVAFAGDQATEMVGKAKAVSCLACHGKEGVSPTPYWPSLAGQNEAYLVKQLKDYRARRRDDGLMAEMTDTLSLEDMAEIAAYLATLPPSPRVGEDQHGERIYKQGLPDQGVPPCSACHGLNGEGVPQLGYPALAGQREDYLRRQMIAFRAGRRQNDVEGVMTQAVAGLKYSDLKAVVRWLAGAKGESSLHR